MKKSLKNKGFKSEDKCAKAQKNLKNKGEKKMRNLKNQKGITLVALVVTIIVLLILAGVSLSLVAGGDGILTRASNAVTATEVASAGEQAELLIAEIQTAFYEAKYADGKDDVFVYQAGDTIAAYVTRNIGKKTTSDGYNVSLDTAKSLVTITKTDAANKITEIASREYEIKDDKIKFKYKK